MATREGIGSANASFPLHNTDVHLLRVEDNDLSDCFSVGEFVHTRIDVGQFDSRGNELLDRQLPVAPQLRVDRDVAGRDRRSQVAADNGPRFGDQSER